MISSPSLSDFGTHDESRYPELWEGCVGAWAPCLGPTGTRLHDFSRGNNWGVFANIDQNEWQVSRGKYAIDFDYASGANRQAVEVGQSSSVRGMALASISMWVNLQAAPTVQAGIYYESTSSDGFTKFGLFQSTTNQILFVCRDTASGSSFAITATPTAGLWLHVCGTYNANSDLMELFFNGISVGTNTTAKGVLHDSAPASQMCIGAFAQNSNTGLQYSCSAFIDDVRIVSKVFSRSEVLLLASDRGVAYQRRRRRSYFATEITPAFRASWIKKPSQLIGGGTY